MSIVRDGLRHAGGVTNDPRPKLSWPLSGWSIAGIAAIAGLVVASYVGTINHLAVRWLQEADYSHGFFVPLVSGWLLWQRRSLIAFGSPVRGRWLGLALLVFSGLLRLLAVYFSLVLADPIALIACIAAVPVLIGGFPALRWSWPAILFLFFMVPLPGVLSSRLGGPLQHVATACSTYTLQTLGIPAIDSGNVIFLSNGQIGVVEACNGLRMLMLFCAMATAAVFILKIPTWEKAVLLLSSVFIAIASNVFRISLTGVSQELFGVELAQKIFHDFAGWIMMPVAGSMLAIEVYLLSKLFPIVDYSPPVLFPKAGRSAKPSGSC
jgi:exosortase